ncbi:MAG: hypothetical protein A3H91_14370 [Gammaproteobacteria bacterium RIFCSPLOWO2_02_FULL_61_13]|nr:MAG: hypothetical protein A3H91_14370 [Gammaproteobacteria bacterium RIFCSPLOWO2_02_FULL_61_13]
MYDARILFAGLILTLSTGSAAAVTVYECEDDKGNRTFESACPPGTKEVKEKDYSGTVAPAPEANTGDLPEVTLYLVPECDTCVQTRDYLEARDIPFTSKDVSTDFALQDELKKRSGALRAPTVMIGDQAVVGFNRASLTTALQEAGHIPAEEEGVTGEAETGAAEAEPGTEPETPAP